MESKKPVKIKTPDRAAVQTKTAPAPTKQPPKMGPQKGPVGPAPNRRVPPIRLGK